MKKRSIIFTTIIMLIIFGLIGCTGNPEEDGIMEEGEHTSEGDTGKSDETVNNESDPIKFGYPDEPTSENNFDWEALSLEDLRNGQLTSLKFQIGTSFDDIIDQWGIPKNEDYMRGGKFYHYDKENHDFFFFDPEVSETVTHIQINPKYAIKLDDIRELLGEPSFDEEDMMSGNWMIGYYVDHYTLYVQGKTNDRNSDVLYLFLKSEP